MIPCLAANPSIDRTLAVERLVIGQIHRPHQVAVVAGGKGLNVARAANLLGGQVRAVALLGGHAGRWIAEQCEREGWSWKRPGRRVRRGRRCRWRRRVRA